MPNRFTNLSLRQVDDAIAVMAFNRPDAANALNRAMAMDIKAFLTSDGINGLRCLIVTGEGRHFCAGADLKERQGMTEDQWHTQHYAFEEAQKALMECPIPVIAAVNGAAFGGGLEMALACDFIYASEAARFGLTETGLGIIPGMGGTQLLPRAVGMRQARELIYTGRAFTAAEAKEYGMINRLCQPSALMEDAIACARAVAANAPLAVKAAKSTIMEGISKSFPQGWALELSHYNTLLASKDRHEGINAFNEKRKASFTGS